LTGRCCLATGVASDYLIRDAGSSGDADPLSVCVGRVLLAPVSLVAWRRVTRDSLALGPRTLLWWRDRISASPLIFHPKCVFPDLANHESWSTGCKVLDL